MNSEPHLELIEVQMQPEVEGDLVTQVVCLMQNCDIYRRLYHDADSTEFGVPIRKQIFPAHSFERELTCYKVKAVGTGFFLEVEPKIDVPPFYVITFSNKDPFMADLAEKDGIHDLVK